MLYVYSDSILKGDENITPKECLAVLTEAKPDFYKVMAKIIEPEKCYSLQLTSNECLAVVNYLCAHVVLKHLQRPGVVRNMTVSVYYEFHSCFFYVSKKLSLSNAVCLTQVEEWINRTRMEDGHAIIGVREHKTGSQQVASFVLTPEEETVS